MKVLFLATRFLPSRGGVEKHIEQLIKALNKNYESITILVEKHSKNLEDYEKINLDGTEVKIIRILPRKEIRWKIHKQEYWNDLYIRARYFLSHDIVHCHDYQVFIHWLLKLKIIFFWKKVFVTFHGWEGHYPPQIKVILLRRLTNLLCNASLSIGKFIDKWYGTKSNYISIGACKNLQPTIKPKTKSLLFLGRLEKDTGIIKYLDAARILRNEDIDFTLTIAGDGSLRKFCENYALENSIKVNFLGWVSDIDLELQRHQIVLSSGYLAILEAMSAKRVVIATYENSLKLDYLQSIPDYQEVMCIKKEAVDIAKCINGLFEDGIKYNKIASSGYNLSKLQSWTRMAEVYQKMWLK